MAQFQALEVQNAGLGPLPTDEDKLNYINFYANLLKKVDHELSHVTRSLYEEDDNGNRLADDALVIQVSDHGELGLAHGGLRQKMFMAYEENIRVPMVFSNPILFNGESPQNSMALATLVDIMPTLVEIAKVPNPPAGLRGVSLVPVMKTGDAVQNDILFTFDDTKAVLNNKPSMVNAANRIRCVRTEEWKYCYYFGALGNYANQYELYNLINDPDELTNLAYDDDYADVRAEMEERLQQLERQKLLIHTPDK